MIETWLSKERLLSNSTPRFLTDDEESTEQPSSVRQCSRLLRVGALGLITNTSVFSEFSSKKKESTFQRKMVFYTFFPFLLKVQKVTNKNLKRSQYLTFSANMLILVFSIEF